MALATLVSYSIQRRLSRRWVCRRRLLWSFPLLTVAACRGSVPEALYSLLPWLVYRAGERVNSGGISLRGCAGTKCSMAPRVFSIFIFCLDPSSPTSCRDWDVLCLPGFPPLLEKPKSTLETQVKCQLFRAAPQPHSAGYSAPFTHVSLCTSSVVMQSWFMAVTSLGCGLLKGEDSTFSLCPLA